MKRNGVEQTLVILLFVLVFVIFSFAERDSKKLDRLYNTAQLLQKRTQLQMVQRLPAPEKISRN